MEQVIQNTIKDAARTLGIESVSFVLERPADITHGDFATNVALVCAKELGKSPKEVAELFLPFMQTALKEIAERVEVAGPGFINITLKKEVIHDEVVRAAHEGVNWGKGDSLKEKRIAIEYACPNPFKEMHIGHLMSTIIGESVARLIENAGAKVIRDTYGGDVGPHVAKALFSFQKQGITNVTTATEVDNAYQLGAKAYEEDETAKKEIDELNQLLYQGSDEKLMVLWRACREACLQSFKEIFSMLGTHFDYYFFESEVTEIGIRVVREGISKGVFEESDGAIIYAGEKRGLHTLVFITSQGTPTYEAKDIGLAFYKEERIESNAVIIETGAEQIGHFKVFLSALSEIAPHLASKTTHLSHGLMVDTEGKKLASRKGNAMTASALLSLLTEKAKERNEDPVVARKVSVAAIKFMILRQAPGSNIVFDPEKSLSLEGDSGPYLQYAAVRAQKILHYDSKGGGQEIPSEPFVIERLITRFPEVCARAERERSPHYVAQYLTTLASAWNSFYGSEQVLGSEEEAYKLVVTRAFYNTMKNGLNILGIEVPERM